MDIGFNLSDEELDLIIDGLQDRIDYLAHEIRRHVNLHADPEYLDWLIKDADARARLCDKLSDEPIYYAPGSANVAWMREHGCKTIFDRLKYEDVMSL